MANGSSPRAWGTLGEMKFPPDVCRFIPTCMGNSLKYISLKGVSSVHPHVHGELIYIPYNVVNLAGSSPRAWGTLSLHGLREFRDRFIPTCMGNSRDYFGHGSKISVHPHVHGEL